MGGGDAWCDQTPSHTSVPQTMYCLMCIAQMDFNDKEIFWVEEKHELETKLAEYEAR